MNGRMDESELTSHLFLSLFWADREMGYITKRANNYQIREESWSFYHWHVQIVGPQRNPNAITTEEPIKKSQNILISLLILCAFPLFIKLY